MENRTTCKYTFLNMAVLAWLAISVLFSNSSTAQTFHYTQYSVEDGLAQSQVLSLYQEKNGNLWVGTNGEGISMFNGKSFVNITTEDGLTGNYVYTIVEDSKGALWFGTNNGVSILKGGKYTNFTIKDGLPHNRVYAIAEDTQRDQVWIATEKGVAIYKNGKITIFAESEDLVNTFVFTVLVDGRDVWFGTFGKGLIRYNGNDFRKFTTKSGLHKDYVRTLELDLEGNILVGTINGLNYYDTKADTIVRLDINYDSNTVNTVTDCFVKDNGDIWIAIYSGSIHKFQYKKGKLELKFSIYSIGSAKNIWTIFEDIEENIWFGTIDFGLFKFGGLRFYNYSAENDGLHNNSVYAICESSDGNYWIGTKNFGISRMITFKNSKKAEFENYTYSMENHGGKEKKILRISGSSVTSIMEDNKKTLWVTTSNGITKIKNDTITNYTSITGSNVYNKNIVKKEMTSSACNHIMQDSRGTYWVGTPNGITKIVDTSFINFNKKFPVFEKKYIYQTFEDDNKDLWFVTDSGAYYYNHKELTKIGKEDGLVDEMVVCVTQDKRGNYWFGTKEGVYMYNPETGFKNISISDGLASNNIYLLIFDDVSNLFIGTPKGLDVLDARRFVNEEIVNIRHFGNMEGFIGQECNLNASYKDSKGKLWFGTVKGVTVFDPTMDKLNQIKPITQITNLKLDYKEFDFGPFSEGVDSLTGLPIELVLPYNKNHLTFDFVAASLTEPGKVMYQVMLEGLDSDWSPPRTKNEAEYPALPPGTYTFKVRACNNDGVWMDEPTTFTFTIKPPFWRTWWFYTIVVVIILIIIYIFIKRREAALKRDKMVLEEKVKERTAEVVKQKEIVEQKNKDITDSINYAKNIQLALLPSLKEFEDRFPDSFILYKPRDIVSGDFYWMTHKENRTFFAASDCTGHGVPGAFMSMLGIAFLDEIVSNNPDIQANEILDQLRYNVIESLHQTGKEGESKDGMDMALVIVEWDNRRIQYAGANNPLYLIRDLKLEETKPDKMPIGFHIKKQIFTNHVIDIQPHDTIYVFSDGFPDQFGGPSGKKFKYKQFKDVLLEISYLAADKQKVILEDKLEKWKGNYDQLDDILVMGIKFKEEHFNRETD